MDRMITSDARSTLEIKSRIAIRKAAFNNKNTYFHKQIVHEFKEETIEVAVSSA